MTTGCVFCRHGISHNKCIPDSARVRVGADYGEEQ